VTTLGTIYSSSLFPGRCPSGEILLLNYIGGATNRGVKDATTEQLAEQVRPRRGAPLTPHCPSFGIRCIPHCPRLLCCPHPDNHPPAIPPKKQQVDKDVRKMLLKPDAPPPRIVGVRVWPRAIPQFNVGHLDQLDKAKQVGAGLGTGLAAVGIG
jgi:oxygen-dependent protoporphyrinogen oxidase